ncbi:MAG: DUF1801 domain-containing protein [bacterium]
MDPLFTVNGAVRYDPAVDLWLDTRAPALGSLARQWFAVMRGCGDDVLALIHDGCPVACIDDAAFAYVNAFNAHVNVGFFRGAELADPTGILLGTGRQMRHVKLKPTESPDTAALTRLIAEAYTNIKAHLAVER